MRFRMGMNIFDQPQQQTATGGLGHGLDMLGMLPMLNAQAAEEAQNSAMKRQLMQSQQTEAAAHAALFGQEAEDKRTAAQRGTLPEVLKTTLMQSGVPLYQVPEAADYFQSGQLAGKYDLPGGQAGPVLPKPQYADPGLGAQIMQRLGLTQQALTVGDKDVAHIADASGKYQDQGLVDLAVARANAGDDMGLSRLNSIRGKKEFTPFAAVGNTGVALNQVTGQGNVAEPGLRAIYGDVQGAVVRKDNAAAGASNASAEHSRASTAKVRQETDQGVRTGNLQVVTGPNGEVTIVDKVTRTAQPVLGADGKPVIKGAAGGGGKPMTEGQAKANIYGGRMMESDRILSDLEGQGVTRPGNIKSLAQGVAGAVPLIGAPLAEGAAAATNWTQSPQQQQVEQARRDFVNAVLRRESGAAISQSEFDNASKQYFPQPGDSPQVLTQKRRNRQIATTLMLQEVPEAQRYKPGTGYSSAPAAPAPAGTQSGGASGSWGGPQAPAGWSIERVN